MNKGPIAKFQNCKGQIENSYFNWENGPVLKTLFIIFIPRIQQQKNGSRPAAPPATTMHLRMSLPLLLQ
jgi:hypothetical protein